MTHRVHPYSFRLGQVRDWKSRWFDMRNYRKFLETDVRVRSWLGKKLAKMYVSKVEIERTPAILKIIIHTSRPGLLIGRSGAGINSLKKEIENFFKKYDLSRPQELQLAVEEIKNPETNAAIVAQMIIENLEKRFRFRRVLKQILSKVSAHKEVKGVKVALSGRLDGAEMSRSEWLIKGQLPLQTIRADIDFAKARAKLPYGEIGIKVWIYKGEVFSEK